MTRPHLTIRALYMSYVRRPNRALRVLERLPVGRTEPENTSFIAYKVGRGLSTYVAKVCGVTTAIDNVRHEPVAGTVRSRFFSRLYIAICVFRQTSKGLWRGVGEPHFSVQTRMQKGIGTAHY